MIRPTPVAVFYFSLSVPVALLIVTMFPNVWYTSLYLPGGVLALILADATMLLPNRRVLAHVRAPRRLSVGHTGSVGLSLECDKVPRPTHIFALLEQTGDADHPTPVSGVLENSTLNLDLAVTPRRRGQIRLVALWLRWRGPLHFVELRRRQPIDQMVEVVPDVKALYDQAIRFFSRDAVYGSKSQRMTGEGAEFETLTEFAPGMDTRFIDWKRTARHRKLLAKEFRQERNHQIVLGFDTGHLMLEPVGGVSKLDHAIRAGLSLGWVSLYSGDLLGGCGFDVRFRSFLRPGRGMPYFSQFQRFTAGLEYRTEETNFTLGLAELNARLQRRALVVLFTEFVDTISAELLIESLQLMTRRHLVVFVTLRDPMLTALQNAQPTEFGDTARAVIASDFLRERAIVLERIARLGVHCLDVPAEAMSIDLLNRYLLIKQRGLL